MKTKFVLFLMLFATVSLGCKEKPVEIEDDPTGNPNEPGSAAIIYTDSEIVRRPVPTTGFIRSNQLEDLIYYDENFVDLDPGTVFSNLPPTTPVVSASDFLNATFQGSQYGTAGRVNVSHPEFSQAFRVNISTLPDLPYSAQLLLREGLKDRAENGDMLLLTVWMRTISGGQTESQTGQLQLIIEENGGAFDKILIQNIHARNEWTKFYFPVQYSDGYVNLIVRCGYYIQTVEIGGYEIRNYGKSVSMTDMPTTGTYVEGLSKNAGWRASAFERIEKNRKGDFYVIVKNADGNVVPDADVELNMYEHEFQFGAAIPQSRSVLSDGDPRFRTAIQRYFNGAVLENNHKWAVYENDPARARALVDAVKALDIKYFRGHCLVWDRTYRPGSTMPPYDLLAKYNNRNDLNDRIRNHINRIVGDFRGELNDWDVLNEPVANSVTMDVYGKSLINDWFSFARVANPNAKLFVNEYIENHALFNILDEMVGNNVDFDGIGIQSHFTAPADPASIYDFYQRLAQYNKIIKVTEFDFATDNEILQATFLRDFMITMFSHEVIEGFYQWRFHNTGTENIGAFFNSNWLEKPGLDQFIDLVYNKWWTNETGKTNDDGIFSVRGFYGDYDITVSANGITKTLSVGFQKNKGNTVTVYLTEN